MGVTAETNRNLASAPSGCPKGVASRLSLAVIAILFTAVAGNCLLKYTWWTACHSAWSGVPRLAAQWQAAGDRATLYGWSLLALESAGVIAFFTSIRSRSASVFGNALRFAASLAITLAATGLFAWVLSLRS